MPSSSPISLIAERAVRYLRERDAPQSSIELAKNLLSTQIADERTATKILATAFGADPRLVYKPDGWRMQMTESRRQPTSNEETKLPWVWSLDRAWLILEGAPRNSREPFELQQIHAIRMGRGDVVAACSGEPLQGARGELFRETLQNLLEGAVIWSSHPIAEIAAFEHWYDEPIGPWISLQKLAVARTNLSIKHTAEDLAKTLQLQWRDTDDPLDLVELYDASAIKLGKPEDDFSSLQEACWPDRVPFDFSKVNFTSQDLRNIPHSAGIYRFFDAEDRMLYVGKAKDLHRRIHHYFRTRSKTSRRVQRILENIHRFEYDVTGSELEALIQEARSIKKNDPQQNTQRVIHPKKDRWTKPQSILILEPAPSPHVLVAYFICEADYLGRVKIGPRGGGLKKIERLLDDHYFVQDARPKHLVGDPIDLEIVTRWLGANRDQVVAFDPTDLKNSEEVILRLQYFLDKGYPTDPDGRPVII